MSVPHVCNGSVSQRRWSMACYVPVLPVLQYSFAICRTVRYRTKVYDIEHYLTIMIDVDTYILTVDAFF